MRVLIAGGGSGGSSAPVLAVAEELLRRDPCEFLYVGTSEGPERELVERVGIPFRSVHTGKLRRYWSFQNLADLFRVPMGLVESIGIVRGFRPEVAFAAGGFAAVPPLLIAELLRVPTVVHQQDVQPGLANRILAPFATAVTVTFPASLAHFPGAKSRVTGNPVRQEILAGNREDGLIRFDLRADLPVVLVTGGGTGAAGLNRLLAGALATLAPRCQVLHITGRGKGTEIPEAGPGYRQVEFLAEGMGDALAAADLVVSRAGLSTLTELAALGKPSILVPMPASHQEANAAVFEQARAAVVLQEREQTPVALAEAILDLLADRQRLAALAERARSVMSAQAEARIADVLEQVARK